MLVCDGILRARHRLSMSTEDFLTPGEIYRLEIPVGETALAFAAGHRLRLAISSSNHDRFDVNPNTGAPFAFSYEEMRIAHNTVYLDAVHPSRLLLSVVNSGVASAGDPGPGDSGPALSRLTVSPNPSLRETALRFSLGSSQQVTVGVYDPRGRRVVELADRVFSPGRHSLVWDGRDGAGARTGSGVYWLRVAGEDGALSAKVVLVR
jgi:hypothetical protein